MFVNNLFLFLHSSQFDWKNKKELILFQYPDPLFSAKGDFYIQILPRNEGKDVGDFLHIAKVPSTVSDTFMERLLFLVLSIRVLATV